MVVQCAKKKLPHLLTSKKKRLSLCHQERRYRHACLVVFWGLLAVGTRKRFGGFCLYTPNLYDTLYYLIPASFDVYTDRKSN
jgi:hypothetical protein